MNIVRRAIRYIKRHGLRHTLQKAAARIGDKFLHTYHRRFLKAAPSAEELKRQREAFFSAPPKISIVVPVFNTRPVFLHELADSVLNQTYPHFELCLLDGNSQNAGTLAALEEIKKRDERVLLGHSKENLGISGNTNLAIAMATGEYIALLDHDDLLTPDALYEVACAIAVQQADMIYSDEDKIDEKSAYTFSPHFKPDFSPDYLRGINYICHLMVIKKSLLLEAGGLDSGFDGSQDHDLALRASEKAKCIVHIPKVLYHWRSLNTSMSHGNLEKCLDAGTRAVQNQLKRLHIDAALTMEEIYLHLQYKPDANVSVTFIIEHHASDAILKRCLDSLGNPKEVLIWPSPNEPEGTRYSALNRCAECATGELLVFVDSHMVVAEKKELSCLFGRAAMADAGIVAPTILNENGSLRHQGYVLGMDTIVKNPEQHLPTSRVAHNVSAAAVAFFAVRKSVFVDAGMFDVRYHHDLGDVDFCLKLLKKGLYNVVLPECRAMYDGENAIVDEKPNEEDAATFEKAHGTIQDAYYNPNFSHSGRTFQLK